MGEEQLLDLAKQFLQTPEGQKLIADQVDINSLEKKLLELESSNLTREERRENRQNRREKRREEREKKREEREAKIQELKQRIKDQIPQIKSYKIKGRLYDKQTGNPIKGANIIGTQLIIPGKNPKTNSQGEFEIEARVAVLPFNNKVLAVGSGPFLIYTKSGYAPSTQNILNLDKTVKSNLSTFSLLNINEAANQAKAEVQTEIDEGVDKLNSIYLNGVEILIVAKRKSIMRVVEIIKTRLVPLAIGMLIAFGITKLTQKSQKTCPSPDQLKDIIRRRNSVVKQLNQIFAAVTLNSALAIAFLAISKVVKGVRATVDSLPLPLVIGGPGPVGLVFTQTYSTVAKLQNVKDKLKELEESNKDLNKQILIALLFLIVALTIILLLLKGIDNLVQECSEEENIKFEEISEELLDLTQEAEEEGTPVITNINGFILSVETLKNTPGELKRRQAIAKDSRGVTLLKGEPSFASSDQILIDELVFYIQQNNLKAN
ncbi:hypothetical protein N9Z41_01110 [bacterium]|nr:hypothetical protein [bacterium]